MQRVVTLARSNWRPWTSRTSITTTRRLTDCVTPPSMLDRYTAMVKSSRTSNSFFHLNKIQKHHLSQLDSIVTNFEQSLLYRVVVRRPELLAIKPESLRRDVHLLSSQRGASPDAMEEFLCRSGKLLLTSPSTLAASLTSFATFCDIKRLKTMRILSQLPSLLTLNVDHWTSRYNQLRVHFENSKLLTKLIEEAPSVLMEDWEQLESKINYLYHTMHVAPYKVAESGVLQFDLDFLQTRYTFLERAGLYKHPSPKSFDPSSTGLPLIEDILIADVDLFLNKTTSGLFTREDFSVFVNLLSNEEESVGDDEECIDDEGRRERINEALTFSGERKL